MKLLSTLLRRQGPDTPSASQPDAASRSAWEASIPKYEDQPTADGRFRYQREAPALAQPTPAAPSQPRPAGSTAAELKAEGYTYRPNNWLPPLDARWSVKQDENGRSMIKQMPWRPPHLRYRAE